MTLLNLQSLFGFFALLFIAWLLSENKRVVAVKFTLMGILLQFTLAFLFFKVPVLQALLTIINDAVLTLQQATEASTSFVFGYLGGGTLPFEETQAGASFILAFRALPLVIIMSAITSILMHWKILPWLVQGLSKILQKTVGISGSVGIATAANIFIGMVEAPLFIRPWIRQLSRSELFILMTAGMATIAGTVLVLYATILSSVQVNSVGHLLIASFISAPAAVIIARLMVPETETISSTQNAETANTPIIPVRTHSTLDALTQGTKNGLQLFLNIIAMLLVLVALVHIVNGLLSLLPTLAGENITLERLLGYVMSPIVWLMGIPWSEALTAGSLMGVKTVLNEFLAYLQLAQLPEVALSDRSRLIMTYALCGFANAGSLGIMIAGLTTMAPERKQDVLNLGVRSIIAGTLATCCTGAVVGVLI
jgi:CNT family concentrative nucleoside transporter